MLQVCMPVCSMSVKPRYNSIHLFLFWIFMLCKCYNTISSCSTLAVHSVTWLSTPSLTAGRWMRLRTSTGSVSGSRMRSRSLQWVPARGGFVWLCWCIVQWGFGAFREYEVQWGFGALWEYWVLCSCILGWCLFLATLTDGGWPQQFSKIALVS